MKKNLNNTLFNIKLSITIILILTLISYTSQMISYLQTNGKFLLLHTFTLGAVLQWIILIIIALMVINFAKKYASDLKNHKLKLLFFSLSIGFLFPIGLLIYLVFNTPLFTMSIFLILIIYIVLFYALEFFKNHSSLDK